jgi:uncharacterized protein (TIGR02231 family)
VEAQTRDLKRELAARQQDLARVRPQVSQVRALTLRLHVQKAGQVRLRYLFQDAGWRLAYRAFLDTASGQVTLERVALIGQRSGEDWRGIQLALSTGQAAQRADIPHPVARALRLVSPRSSFDAHPAAAAAPVMMSKAVRLAGDGHEEAVMAAAPLFPPQVSQGEFATTYHLPTRIDLPADGRRITVTLERQRLPVALERQILPRQSRAAWLVARGDLPEGVWPPGETRLYRNGVYIGKSNWNPLAREGLLLPFGRDEKIMVDVKNFDDTQGSGGFIAQKNERRMKDIFILVSHHDRPVDVLVLEESMVTRDDGIAISRELTPAISEDDWQGMPGIAAWKATLNAGERREFSASYRISWPEDRRIIGWP